MTVRLKLTIILKLILGCLLALLLIYPLIAQPQEKSVTITSNSIVPLQTDILEKAIQEYTPPTVQELIGDPRLIRILKCESNLKQFDVQGNPLMSRTMDIGISQINIVHWKKAKELGLDIFGSAEDNITMGKIILKSSGYKAWTCAKIVGII